jgi:hypothetical protein
MLAFLPLGFDLLKMYGVVHICRKISSAKSLRKHRTALGLKPTPNDHIGGHIDVFSDAIHQAPTVVTLSISMNPTVLAILGGCSGSLSLN